MQIFNWLQSFMIYNIHKGRVAPFRSQPKSNHVQYAQPET
jgi:hypothetical protein